MTDNPEIKYFELLEHVNEEITAIFRHLSRIELVAGRVQSQLEKVDPESIREAAADGYCERIERLELRIEFLERRLKSFGIHPDEDFTFSQELEIRQKLERLPL